MARKTKLFQSVLLAAQQDGSYLTFVDGNGNQKAAITSLKDLNRFCIETLAGSVRVFGSLDGENYAAQQLVLSEEPAIVADAVTEPEGTFAAVTTAGTLAWFFGDWRALRFQQIGATDAQVRILGSGD